MIKRLPTVKVVPKSSPSPEEGTTVGIVETYFAMSVQTIRCLCLPQPSQCAYVITAIPYSYKDTLQRGTESRLLYEVCQQCLNVMATM